MLRAMILASYLLSKLGALFSFTLKAFEPAADAKLKRERTLALLSFRTYVKTKL